MSTTGIVMLVIYAVVFGGGSLFLVSYSLKKRNDRNSEKNGEK